MFWAAAARFALDVWSISSGMGRSVSWFSREVETSTRRVPIGVEGSRNGIRAQIDGDKPFSLAELALFLPVQIIDPEVHHLIEEGPSRRRRFLDWGVFHVEQSFVGHWQRYQQVLKQRNAALKARQPKAVVSVWDGDLVRSGELLGAARVALCCPVEPIGRGHWPQSARNGAFLELSKWMAQRSEHDRGAAAELEPRSGDAVPRKWARIARELGIRLDGAPVKDRISRGQQKLLAAALLIAQIKLFPEGSPVQPPCCWTILPLNWMTSAWRI